MKTIRNIYSERNFLFLLLHRVGETEAYELTSLLEAEHPNERVLNLIKIDQSTLGEVTYTILLESGVQTKTIIFSSPTKTKSLKF